MAKIKSFKIPDSALRVNRVRKGKKHTLPKPENTDPTIPTFSVAGLLINGIQVGSTLEWNVAQALDIMDLDYNYQVSVFGGRWVPGGAVIDFEVYLKPVSVYLFAQGDYWHTRGNKEEEDAWLMARIQAELHKECIEIWEHEALTVQMATLTIKKN